MRGLYRGDVIEELLAAYQGEVFGMAMYRSVADAQTDEWRRWQWECLHRLEVEVHDDLADLLRRRGVDPVPDPVEHAAGRREAERIVGLPWTELLDEFAADLPQLIETYGALAESPALTAAERAVLRRVTEHEVAALDYCLAERSGVVPDASIGAVVSMLREAPAPPGG